MDLQMKAAMLKPSDLIPILSSLHDFKMACVSNAIYEGAAMLLFQYFIKDPAKAAIGDHVSTTVIEDPQKEREPFTHCQVVSCLLSKYGTDNVVAEAEAEIMNMKNSEHISPVWYSKCLWGRTVRCGRAVSCVSERRTS